MSKSYSYSPVWRLISVIVLAPLLRVLIRHKWQGRENIPKKGPVILAPNHLSYVDWGTDALFFYVSGRYPTFLIKDSAFKVKFIGPFLRKAGQLPVYRGRADAALVLRDAEQALAAGAAVIIYPESTATRDPELWPMVSKTGVARLALATGAPVIPVAHWGTQDILPYGSKKVRLFPRKTVRTVAGPPVDLSQWAGQESSAKALRAATAAIMKDVTALLAKLRGEEPPAVPYDPSRISVTDGGASPELQAAPNGDGSPSNAQRPTSTTSPKAAGGPGASPVEAEIPTSTTSPKAAGGSGGSSPQNKPPKAAGGPGGSSPQGNS